ncbi:bifunctional lysylphosphatidylglycerol synthetase/lysine--tRNA ligase LysX [Corynebacterium sp. TAE3-ERU12]|uniref:bifunctional lysylphosphatidylglycerol synthetase/lysine--tRNA ligase LysX n=1 Tax=Corynebacterium sp. TAE3-ERU12 TaxID=2849491 RepID=UPI001C45AE8D|nr:bifunctional lysylphosphatidylglycerol synthetase/lysine--tRNA ligase LysX [Corynebacterium sp. TAE3-ERU12]
MAQSRVLRAVPAVYGWLLTCYAVVALVFSVVSPLRGNLRGIRELLDIVLLPIPEYSVSWALVLFIIAAGIFARKRAAWWVIVTITAASNVYNLGVLAGVDLGESSPAGLYWIGVGTQTLILIALVLTRDLFPAQVRRAAVGRAVGVFALLVIIGTACGWALVRTFPGTGPAALVAEDRFWWTLNRVLGFSLLPLNQFDGHPPQWVALVVSFFGAVALLGAVFTLLRSQGGQNSLTAADETAIRAMLTRWGANDSLGYFATRRDKSVVYANSGRAAVSYRVEVGVILASGDPIGDPDHWDSAITNFLLMARNYGWTPAVMGASAAGARAWRRAGLSEFHLGDEAIIDTADYRISGPDRKALRQAVHRAGNAGVSVRIRRHGEISADEFVAISADADRWRDTTDERGFSMALGRLGDPADSENLLVEALHGGKRVALLSFSPWGRTGASLDTMRRAPQAPNGCVELMVTSLCQNADGVGVRRISLNFAVFRTVFASEDELGVGPLLRLNRGVLTFLSRFWQMEALYRSNQKYAPQWVPRYVCFANRRTLPSVALAGGIAEGFMPWPQRTGRLKHSTTSATSPAARAAYAAVPDILAGGAPAPRRIPEQTAARIAEATAMQASGVNPWPVAAAPDTPCAGIAGAVAQGSREVLSIAGRVLAKRDFGGVIFLRVRDFTGDCQVLVERTSAAYQVLSDVDLADLVRVDGVAGRSDKGEPSLFADSAQLTAKGLHPLPDKRRGLRDPETRVRNRHVDLAVGKQSREALVARSAILQAVRGVLVGKQYLEVETPILQQVHGGANARPFRTHINAYDQDVYLRIAPELYLKRLLCGGVERVFELGRTFRNEGVDATHNPEFTILEAYEIYGDYTSMRLLCQHIVQQAAIAANGQCTVPGPDGQPVDISGDWPVVRFFDAITTALRARGIETEQLTAATDAATLRRLCDQAGVPHRPDWDAGQISLEMYERLVEEHTGRPTFYTDFPTSVSPLTRAHRSEPGVAERWDLVAWGVELGTAYTELTDPLEQRRRLEQQSLLAADGDPEAMEVDEDFLRALEFGMPPTGGLGMGIDRLVMLITGLSIRDSLPFPFVRPEADPRG